MSDVDPEVYVGLCFGGFVLLMAADWIAISLIELGGITTLQPWATGPTPLRVLYAINAAVFAVVLLAVGGHIIRSAIQELRKQRGEDA